MVGGAMVKGARRTVQLGSGLVPPTEAAATGHGREEHQSYADEEVATSILQELPDRGGGGGDHLDVDPGPGRWCRGRGADVHNGRIHEGGHIEGRKVEDGEVEGGEVEGTKSKATKSKGKIAITPEIRAAVRRLEIRKAENYACARTDKWVKSQQGLKTRYARRLANLKRWEAEATATHDARKVAGLKIDIGRVEARQALNVQSKSVLKHEGTPGSCTRGVRPEGQVDGSAKSHSAKAKAARAKMRAAEAKAAEAKAAKAKAAKAKAAKANAGQDRAPRSRPPPSRPPRPRCRARRPPSRPPRPRCRARRPRRPVRTTPTTTPSTSSTSSTSSPPTS